MDFLKSAVASAIAKGSSFPYTFGDRLDNDVSIWTLHNATKKEDGSSCNIFSFAISANKSSLLLARNAARKLRIIRHPGVIKVLDTIETETNIYVVTEKVTPLSWQLKRKSLSEEIMKWGLYSISSTLTFINEDASSVHGCVRVASIYTSESGEWKLGGFEILSSIKEEDAIIYDYGNLAPESNRYAPPEVASNGWSAIKRDPIGAVDGFGLGTLIFEVFNGSLMDTGQLGQEKKIAPSMVHSYKRLINSNPKSRLSAAHFVELGKKSGGFFETSLIRITDAADSLGLKTDTEREKFLRELDDLSDDFPEDFFKMKILPELLKSVEFGGGGPNVLNAILRIASRLSDDEFVSRLVPVIVRLFASPGRAMRVSLLDNLPLMIDRIPQKEVTNKIFPTMATGFTDTAPVVREQTVKAVLTIIWKLSDRIINGELLRYLAKTASDEQPGIRTNTTICLGKIAKNLGTSTRSKVLIAAFSRSMRDPFVHARNAALMALGATIDVFSDDDCATKILPAICLSIVDKEKIVRDQANKTLDMYLQRVRKYAATLPDTALPHTANGATTYATAPRMGNVSDTSWAGWAISSFTNKVTAARGDMQTAATDGGTAVAQKESRPASLSTSGRSTPTMQVTERPATGPSHAIPVAPTNVPEFLPEEDFDNVLNAWGTIDDDDDNFFDAQTSRKPAIAPALAAKFDDHGEPDFAGWLSAQNQAKSKKPMPKGLTKNTASTVNGPRPGMPDRPASAGNTRAGTGARRTTTTNTIKAKVVAPPKSSHAKPREPDANEDEWPDAWD